MPMEPFGISVIICVHNGAGRISSTLRALSEQVFPVDLPCELLIIDNASTDSTGEIAQEVWNASGSPFPLRVIEEKNPGKANALVTGYNAALYELMLLCDDDNWLQPDYLKIVAEVYRLFPAIGLLGGYGKALFEPGEQPGWFGRWENCYVCGKHHLQNGFLPERNYSIWGAGSVLRKTMWNFLRSNGFAFYNSTGRGKAMTEDAELSMIITFTGHRLYFDDRLCFTHDLRGGRVTWKNFLGQQSLNGKNHAILYMYRLAFYHVYQSDPKMRLLFAKNILSVSWNTLKERMTVNNRPMWIFFFHILLELVMHPAKYRRLAEESFTWIRRIRDTLPLNRE